MSRSCKDQSTMFLVFRNNFASAWLRRVILLSSATPVCPWSWAKTLQFLGFVELCCCLRQVYPWSWPRKMLKLFGFIGCKISSRVVRKKMYDEVRWLAWQLKHRKWDSAVRNVCLQIWQPCFAVQGKSPASIG